MTKGDTVALVTTLAVLGVLLVICGTLFIQGRIRMNPLVGIRIPSTMKSDDAWMAAHKAAGPFIILGGLCAILGVGLIFILPSLGTVALSLIPLICLLVFVVISVIVASKTATQVHND